MNPFFSTLFKKNTNLEFPDSPLIHRLEEVSNNKLSIFKNLTIYHADQSIDIPLLMLDADFGIYLFEYKEWTYKHLKNSTIDKSANQIPNKNNLYFTKIHKFIEKKFDDITNTNGIKIFNFLLVENLTNNEYDNLDESFKELLPRQRIIFNDSSEVDILNKMQTIPRLNPNQSQIDSLMATLLVQYLIIDEDNKFLATREQRDFIDTEIESHQTLQTPSYSGKSSCLLLKSISLKLKNPELKTIIITPTKVDSNILKQQLLNILEYSMINIDVSSIEIITPIELLNKHLKKLKKDLLDEELYIDNILMQKNFNIADLIMCDDSDLLPREFISYLIHTQKNSGLLLVTSEIIFDKQQVFQKSFRPNTQKFIYEQTETYPKTLQIIKELLENHTAKDILIVSSTLKRKDFENDLNFYIYGKTDLLNSSTNLMTHDLKNLTLSSYNQLSSIRYKFVILLDIHLVSIAELVYASNLSKESVYYLYDEECQNINILRNKFET